MAFVARDAAHVDERPHRAEDAERQGDEKGQADIHFVDAPQDVMAELMRQQDGEQCKRERPAGEEISREQFDLPERVRRYRRFGRDFGTGEHHADQGQQEHGQVEADAAGGFALGQRRDEQDDVASIRAFAEEGHDLVRVQGFGQLVVGLGRVERQLAAVAHVEALFRVAACYVGVTQDAPDDGVENVKFW